MIAANALCSAFRQAYDEHWGYIWGEAGDVWTRAAQDAATREATVEYGSRWIGRRVADCSGLFVWAYKQQGEKIYHGSNTIFNDYTSKTGPLYGEVEIMPGTAVFQVSNGRRTHIGLYVGGGKVIEARGTRSGVIESDLSDWDEWGLLSAVDYSGVTAEVIVLDTVKTLRKGDSGLTVTGYIPLPKADSVVRVKDIELNHTDSTMGRYTSDFTFAGGDYCNTAFGAADESGVRSFTNTSSNCQWIRISGVFGDNPIITVDEEITD